METCTPPLNTGLRGVTVASTKISDVIGDEGKLIYRGYLVPDLAGKTTFEEIVHLLLYEKLPNPKELQAIRDSLARLRRVRPARCPWISFRPGSPCWPTTIRR